EAARSYLNHAIVHVGRPAALWSIGFKRMPLARRIQDPCLWYAIRVWRDLHGRAEGAKALVLLDIPPRRCRLTTRYRGRTLAGVRELANRAADGNLRCARELLLFQQDIEEGRVVLLPEVAAALCAPADILRATFPHAAFSDAIDITPSDLVHGFNKWSRVLPNHSVWHELA
ncbi:hypothetical protein H4R19_004744, partial [Coemansia spiralis]